jgi:hypothetical protein
MSSLSLPERTAYTPAEVAASMGLTERMITQAIRKGQLEARRVDGRIVVTTEEAKRFLASRPIVTFNGKPGRPRLVSAA